MPKMKLYARAFGSSLEGMNPPTLFARGTPSAHTPGVGVLHIASEGRASRGVARALSLLVERLTQLGVDHTGVVGGFSGVDAANPQLGLIREALRALSARSREGTMLCRVIDQRLVLEGVAVEQVGAEDEALAVLVRSCVALGVGAVTVREGAAPGELLTLARLLAQPTVPERVRAMNTPVRVMSTGDSDTPRVLGAIGLTHEGLRELLRTWSVLVTPALSDGAPDARVTPADGEAVDGVASVRASHVLGRLMAARTDDAATSAVSAIRELLDDAQRRGDGVAVEIVARTVMTQMGVVADQGGRLALEGALRHLLRTPMLTLLSKQLPLSADRAPLLQLFARAGDSGVKLLVQELLATDDALSRRTYFDSIVAMDVGATQLYDALKDSRWYVVRNAASLLGEMGVEHADETLIPLLHHDDQRIRIAVARALMRLRTIKSLQALHTVIQDSNGELRRLAAAAFGLTGAAVGGGIRPPAARLSAALEVEGDEDVALEMLAALGRLGSADAIQKLLRIALPAASDITGAPLSEPRDPYLRIAALEALVRARGTQMQKVVEALRNDADGEVAAAALGLLRELQG